MMAVAASLALLMQAVAALAPAKPDAGPSHLGLDLPEAAIVEACERAAAQNVLAAVNAKVFPGYWCVCADGQGFGYGNTYPSLDGHQMADALLFLRQTETVRRNWDYVRKFQRPNGALPLAIFPSQAGPDSNGGLYKHWVPGDPLRALAGPTYIQNADVLFRYTQDRAWLARELPSVNLAADYLAALTDADGGVRGAGYYVERPARIEYDGVAQCHAADAFRRVARLNAVAGKKAQALRYNALADRIARHFRTAFWRGGRFAEYIHPERGPITSHGLSDSDWSAIACGIATRGQTAILWPKLRAEPGFRYGGMPTGIAAKPETYEDWEFTTNDRMDLAAMGRVWYVESWARARMGDGDGLLDSIRKVCEVGRAGGYYWRERYTARGPHGAEKYCEYPANLIRIVERFLLGIEFELDGSVMIAPCAPRTYWRLGFGQRLAWRDRALTFRAQGERVAGTYSGGSAQRLLISTPALRTARHAAVTIGKRRIAATVASGKIAVLLPAAPADRPVTFVARPTAVSH